MKKLTRSSAILYMLPGIILLFAGLKIDEQVIQPVAKRSGTAIIMTGAAARLPQEAALLEALYNRGY